MNRQQLVVSACLGAGLMYVFDPVLGRRRRSLVWDGLLSRWRNVQRELEKGWRDASHRAVGLIYELKRPLSKHQAVPDRVLADRVRSKIGRWVSHASAIEVEVHDGVVVLHGSILQDEVQSLVSAVRALPDVQSVKNRLDVHRAAGNISSLQGSGAARRRRSPIEVHWTPATCLFSHGNGGTAGGFRADAAFSFRLHTRHSRTRIRCYCHDSQRRLRWTNSSSSGRWRPAAIRGRNGHHNGKAKSVPVSKWVSDQF